MSEQKTVVVGVDGAHFELIKPWIDNGQLPNIAQMFNSGVTADLKSVLPPVTSPNWKAYSTGKNPGKFGIFWWENINMDKNEVFYPHNRKQAVTEFWEYISESYDVGVIGVPTTYPPKSTGSFYVSGAPDGQNEGYAFPPEVEEELEEKFGYKVTKEKKLKDNVSEAATEIIELIDQRFTAAKHLIEKYNVDFLQVTTFYINSLHHYLWDHKYTLEAWNIIDDHIGYFLERDINLVMMSDHGSTPIDRVFYINSWLEQEGYLTLNEELTKFLYRIGLTTDRLIRISDSLGIRNLAEAHAPSWILNRIPEEGGTISRSRKTDNINWDETQALASGQGPIYIRQNGSPDNQENLTRELKQRVSNLTDDTGSPIVETVFSGDEIYSGYYREEAPEIVLDQRNGIHISGDIGKDSIFVNPNKEGWLAENKRQGIFAATGPIFDEGKLTPLSILDLAPIFLYLFDIPIPTDLDGNVRMDVFDKDSEPKNREVTFQSVDSRENEIKRISQVARTLKDTQDL